MKTLYTTIVLSLFTLQAFAQQYTVTGKVSRKSDNEALKGVYIHVKNNDNIKTKTDADGLYRITINKADTLYIWGMGYKTQEIIVKKNQCNIKLEEDEEFFEIVSNLTSIIYRLRLESNDLRKQRHCPPCTKREKEIQDSIKALANSKIVITGDVTDKGGSKKLQWVEIISKGKMYDYSFTNKEGQYRIKAHLGDTLTFSRFGYYPVKTAVTGNEHTISMIPNKIKYNPEELEKIIDDMNKQINLIRRENNMLIRPRPCTPCPPTEESE